jgi:hypothetical protein
MIKLILISIIKCEESEMLHGPAKNSNFLIANYKYILLFTIIALVITFLFVVKKNKKIKILEKKRHEIINLVPSVKKALESQPEKAISTELRRILIKESTKYNQFIEMEDIFQIIEEKSTDQFKLADLSEKALNLMIIELKDARKKHK